MFADEAARAITGSDELFTVRPEKIRIEAPDAPVGDDDCVADGTVRDVVYLGITTRYFVTLDAGAKPVVVQQNLTASSMEALAAKGRRVRLVWGKQFNRPLEGEVSRNRPGGHSMRARLMCAGLLIAAMSVAAGCGGSSSSGSSGGGNGSSGPTLPQSIGPREGALNLIAWQGYTEDNVVKPFEKQTGCQVNVKYGQTSDEMYQLMQSGQLRRRVRVRRRQQPPDRRRPTSRRSTRH